jgi:hypothetical protein
MDKEMNEVNNLLRELKAHNMKVPGDFRTTRRVAEIIVEKYHCGPVEIWELADGRYTIAIPKFRSFVNWDGKVVPFSNLSVLPIHLLPKKVSKIG